MTGKEWAIPIVLGLVAAGGLWALVASSDGGGDGADDDGEGQPLSTSTPTSAGPQPLILPFRDSWGVQGRNTTHLFVAPLGRAAAEAHINASGDRDAATGTWTWQGDHIALYSSPNLFAGCQDADGDGQSICSDPPWVVDSQPPIWPFPRTYALVHNDAGPRLLHGGYNATRVTAYVFDEAGLLLGSNADANDVALFTKHGDYFRLPSSAWYLGANATAPNGTAHLPGFAKPLVDRVRPELDALPAGGVASVRSNAYVALYGTLFVTMRVDDLVYAP